MRGSIKRLCICAVSLALMPGPAAHAAFPGANGRIAFERINPSTGDTTVFTIDADGTDAKLVAGVGSEAPAWSPDGRWIAYHNTAGPHGVRLFVVRSDGTHRRQVTFHAGDQGYPAWSPDGRWLAFDGNWPDGSAHGFHGGLGIVNVKTGSIHEITRRPSACEQCVDTRPSWSADGRLIAYIHARSFDEGLTALATVRPDGSRFRRLTAFTVDPGNPDWSPDGTTIVFNTNSDTWNLQGITTDIVTIPRNGGRVHYLTHNDPSVWATFQPSWSPNGRSIVFTSYHAGHDRNTLRVMAADGHGRRRVHTGFPFTIFPDWGPAWAMP